MKVDFQRDLILKLITEYLDSFHAKIGWKELGFGGGESGEVG